MVASRKRGRQQVAQEEGQISIRLADNITLSAKANILRTCSSCAEGLPADAQEWDLSQLLVEGEPVTKETAVAWLNSAYQRILDSEFEKQREDVRCSATGLARLLAFADAIGSSRGILAACISSLEDLTIHVKLGVTPEDSPESEPDTIDVKLLTTGLGYSFADYDDANDPESVPQGDLRLAMVDPDDDSWLDEDAGWSTPEQMTAFKQAVAQQVEPLMYLAYSLQLEALQYRIRCFVASSVYRRRGILFGVLKQVVSERVLAAVLPPTASESAKREWISGLLTVPCSFVEAPSMLQLLEPLDEAEGAIHFQARLTQDFMGVEKGKKVRVKVDLFDKGTVQIGEAVWPAQLLLGRACPYVEDLEAVMEGSHSPEGESSEGCEGSE